MVSVDACSQGEYEFDILEPTPEGTMEITGNNPMGFMQGCNVNVNNAYDTNSLQRATEMLPAVEEDHFNGDTTNINNVNVNNITHYNVQFNYTTNNNLVYNNDENVNPNIQNTGLTRTGSVKRKARATPLDDEKAEAMRVTNCRNAEKTRVKKALRLFVAEEKNVMYEKQACIKDEKIRDQERHIELLESSLKHVGRGVGVWGGCAP